MGFDPSEAEALLVACHRRCCICYRFCGVKIELHHIESHADGGSDAISNAIPVCFECHAEIQLYNDRHPRGRKFRPTELLAHKDRWLRLCREAPAVLVDQQRPHDVGPIQALVDELDFNGTLAANTDADTTGALFLTAEFERAIHEGLYSLLPDSVRNEISAAYATVKRANMDLQKMATMPWGGSGSAWDHAYCRAKKAMEIAQDEIRRAHGGLLKYLGHTTEDA